MRLGETSGQLKVKFTDTSEIHEIPPKPKRRQDKRSRSAPGPIPIQAKLRRKFADPPISMEDKSSNGVDFVDNVGDDAAVVVDQFQRASMTSVEDLFENQSRSAAATSASAPNRSKTSISDRDIEALNKVLLNFQPLSVQLNVVALSCWNLEVCLI